MGQLDHRKVNAVRPRTVLASVYDERRRTDDDLAPIPINGV